MSSTRIECPAPSVSFTRYVGLASWLLTTMSIGHEEIEVHVVIHVQEMDTPAERSERRDREPATKE